MIRKAFVMRVHPDRHAEYERRHNPIWAELEEALLAHDVLDYSIFLDRETHCLFAYAVIEDEKRWQAIAGIKACQKWWRHMGDIMETNPDGSPFARDLAEVFHIEGK